MATAAVIWRSNGEIETTDDISLKSLQEVVGGWIEPVVFGTKCFMWVNEDGINLNLPMNIGASYLSELEILGDVIFTGGADDEGNIKALPPEHVARLTDQEIRDEIQRLLEEMLA